MSPVSSPNATALLVLKHTTALQTSAAGAPKPDLVAIANGISRGSETGGNGRGSGVEPVKHPTQDMFSVMSVDINKMKINLMERLGKKLGLALEDFKTATDFGREVERIIGEMKLTMEGRLAIKRMEHELGLDKLGISLDEFVDAITDPKSSAAEKLDAALLREAGSEALDVVEHDEIEEQGWPRIDENGVYSYY